MEKPGLSSIRISKNMMTIHQRASGQ